MPFRDIVGQDRAVARLRRAWEGGRLAQGYCFSGPPGVGKRSTALALAQAVNCLSPVRDPACGDAVDACGACRACARIAAGRHPDVAVVTIEDKTVIAIEQIREMVARTGLRAYEGQVKVWIVDPADRMSEEAANAFLKTLEEPTGGLLFVLVTTAFPALLPTIRSRCQEVRFATLDATHLRTALERRGYSAEEAAAAATAAEGSMERALDPGLAGRRAEDAGIVADLWAALGSIPAILEQAERLGKDKAAFERVLAALAISTHAAAVARVGGVARPPFPSERWSAVEQSLEGVDLRAILRAYEAQRQAQQALAWHAQPRLTAERMLLAMREAVARR
jgi:DNA polymerase-3 subunit delta'